MFHRVVSDSESAVSENESFIDFVNNNVHLLYEQSASVNLSNDVSVTAKAINIQPSVNIDFVNNNVHLLDEQSASVNLSNDVSVTATAINIQPSVFSETVVDEVPAVNTSTLSDSKARGKALKIDFKSMYADFHIAGNSL